MYNFPQMKLLRAALFVFAVFAAMTAGARSAPRSLEEFLDGSVHRALLVGIDDYSKVNPPGKEGMWDNPLSGSKDVEAIRQVLIRRGIFKAEEIMVLKGRVTKQQIIDAINSWLIAPGKTDAHASLFFHYSGHGDLIKAPAGTVYSGQPVEYESGLLPSDGLGHDRSKMLLMHQIAVLFGGLAPTADAKMTQSVTLSFDSCHSGEGVRGAGVHSRGPKLDAVHIKSRGSDTKSAMNDGSFKGYTVLCAAQASQSAGEDENGGYYTQALVKTLDKETAPEPYTSFYEKLRSTMTLLGALTSQYPTLEGDTGKVMFTGELANPSKPYFPIRLSDDTLYMDGGQVHGLTEGTKVALFKAGSDVSNPQNMLGEGVLHNVDMATCTVTLTDATHRAHPVAEFAAARALVESLAVNPGAIGVALIGQEDDVKLLRADLDLPAAPTYTKGVDPSKADCKVTVDADGWHLLDHNGLFDKHYPRTTEGAKLLKTDLASLSHYRLIETLPTNENQCDVQVVMEVVKVKTVVRNGVEELESIAPADGHEREFAPTDHFAVRVKAIPSGSASGSNDNALMWPPYIFMLQLDARHGVQPLWPRNKPNENVNSIPITDGGKWFWLRKNGGFVAENGDLSQVNVWFFTADQDGVGNQTFKLMVTKEPVDFQVLAQPGIPRDGNTRGSNNPLGTLVKSYTNGMRASSTAPRPKEWSTSQLKITTKRE